MAKEKWRRRRQQQQHQRSRWDAAERSFRLIWHCVLPTKTLVQPFFLGPSSNVVTATIVLSVCPNVFAEPSSPFRPSVPDGLKTVGIHTIDWWLYSSGSSSSSVWLLKLSVSWIDCDFLCCVERLLGYFYDELWIVFARLYSTMKFGQLFLYSSIFLVHR